MDIYVGDYLLNKRNKKEAFTVESFGPSKGKVIGSLIFFILSLCISIWASGTSWHCSTVQGYNVILKIIMSLFASSFGWIYLILSFFKVVGHCP